MLTRRELGKLALGVPAATILGRSESIFGAPSPIATLMGFGAAGAQAKPNSLIEGVQIGTITYSYRSMPDQSAEATLKYIIDSGISGIELMGGPVESFAGAPTAAGRGGGGWTWSWRRRSRTWWCRRRGRADAPTDDRFLERPAMRGAGACRGGSTRRRGRRTRARRDDARAARRAAGAGRQDQGVADERLDGAVQEAAQMYNDAGVTIYAWKQLSTNMSDEEYEYIFNVAEALGCTHTTLELPTDAAALKRLGDFAMKKKIYAAYHTHLQGNMTAFDQAFALSKGNMANVDFGHWVAAGNVGGTPMQFLEKHHDRISSFHLKDRTTPANCALNLAWGTGETPIKPILQLVKKNKWKMPASVELEYAIPEGSDAVKEVKKCVDFCRTALTS